ncbi:Basic leucine zipper and W2 domain-containing protein 1 [Saguinus oedipus]|uniref:Basic leucine zipper and W2 domain-containing protein 1 n=1 Tax=Saguinus oedipus TaxID=9490 RepID=A0ABQ9UZI9_SAGOE|nr:Basic leucine zipper and W2 domain-containing protein 1 [Saguinus oedipus]
MDNRLMELLSANKQSIEHFTECFTEAGLKELSEYVHYQQTIGAHKALQRELQEQMSCGDPFKDIIFYAKEEMKKTNIRINCHWMSLVGWNEHCGMEQKRRACIGASHQAL